jgi:DNA-binding CsgD family transcriptional regulator
MMTAGQTLHSLERALDWLADGVALIGADGTVIYANRSFHAIAQRSDGIALRKGMIEMTATSARARLHAAIAAAFGMQGGNSQTSAGADFPVPRKDGATPYLLHMRPLLNKDGESRGEPSAIVFVRDPLNQNAAAVRILREVFGLTDAEALLAQAVQAGISLACYARSHAVSLNTVYTHLRRIREKTGCNRMAELISKLNDLHVPLRLA